MNMAGGQTLWGRLERTKASGAELCLEFSADLVLLRHNIDSRSNVLGIHPSKVEGLALSEMELGSARLQRLVTEFEAVRTTERMRSFTMETPQQGRDRLLQVHIHPLLDKGHRLDRFLVLNKVVPAVIRRLPAHDWQGLYGMSASPTLVFEDALNVAYVNPAAVAIFPESRPGIHLKEALGEINSSHFHLALERCFLEERSVDIEFSTNQNGIVRWFAVSVHPVRGRGEQFAAVSLRETSWLRSQLLTLQEENSAFQHAITGAQAATVAIDLNGESRFANEHAANIPGLLPDGLTEGLQTGGIRVRHLESGGAVHYNSLPHVLVLQGQNAAPIELLWEVKGAQSSISVSLSAQPTRNSEGELTGAMVFVQPLSEQRLEEQAKLSAYHAMTQLVHTVSHDFRIPVNNMVNLCALYQHPSQEVNQEMIFSRLQQSASQLKEQLDGLMTLVRKGAQLSGRSERCALKRIWAGVSHDLSAMIQDKQAEVRGSFSACPELVHDPGLVRSVLFNLTSNAIKYSSPDRSPVVTVRSFTTDDGVCLEVSDNGLGMDLSQSESDLWAPFKRIHTQGSGKGLGLALIKGMVERSGGSIEVQSELGQGSMFRVTLRPTRQNQAQYSLF